MRLPLLLEDLTVAGARGDLSTVDVTSVTERSDAVTTGTLFCCVKGRSADGHDFAARAVEDGAVALLVERFVDVAVPQAQVPDVRAALGPAAAALHGHPSRSLVIAGITGTDGKTTTAHLLRAVFEAHGWPTGLVSTLTSRPGGPPTTPAAPELQATLAGFRDEGKQAVALEVSSHALSQRRVDGVRFAAGVFTNLSQDHLNDYASMDDYFAAKALLFTEERSALGVINVGDPYGERLAEMATIPVVPFSIDDARDVAVGRDSSVFTWRGARLLVGLGGRFNVENALAAATTAAALGIDADAIANGLAAAGPARGRFEVVDAGQPFTVVVDYAHTPAGLEHVLGAARELAGPARVIIVFGCGGDRDRGKRPLMGAVATDLADVAVLTSDNPRSEDPATIIEAVRAGATDATKLVVEPDRAAAIELAVGKAEPGDVVVIAGKGHERGQEIAGQVLPFDDVEVARRALEAAA